MLLRPRQETFVSNVTDALTERGNTLGIAPTGAGKTVMLSKVIERVLERVGTKGRATVVQHRDELVDQNLKTLLRATKGLTAGVVNAKEKTWRRDVTYAMTQTLSRDDNLAVLKLNPQDLLVFDEGHRVLAPSNLKIIETAREANPDVMLYVTTATPNRGDGKGLRAVVDNCADQITLAELIASGHLVRPRTLVIDLGVQGDLREVRRSINDFDMSAVEKIMDHQPLNDAVVKHWRDHAGGRQTVVFCSTVQHAEHVTEVFRGAGVTAVMIEGRMSDAERRAALAAYDRGEIQVIVNVAVLTEGWDHQPTSCVILLRPSSHKSTYMQMIGRGLRTVDPERYPGVRKTDCVVLDFGVSTLTHGSLEQEVDLDGKTRKGRAPTKECPACDSTIPMGCVECPVCGHEFPREERTPTEKGVLTDFIMTEVDLFNQSPFRWEDLWDGLVLVAVAFDAWAMCISYKGEWHALGGSKEAGVRHAQAGDKMLCLASADDFVRTYGDMDGASKQKRWLFESATPKQREILGAHGLDPSLTKYRAACHVTWMFNERPVRRKLEDASRGA